MWSGHLARFGDSATRASGTWFLAAQERLGIRVVACTSNRLGRLVRYTKPHHIISQSF